MFATNSWTPVADMLNFQDEFDRLFNEFWTAPPTRPSVAAAPATFHVTQTEDAWRIDIPMAGIDPQYVNLEAAGTTLRVSVEPHGDLNPAAASRYEQSLTVPQFLDLETMRASHRYGMLQLTLPLKASVKPRRVQIEAAGEPATQLTSAA
jgi:HSP20 family molecular chaperone IbpA